MTELEKRIQEYADAYYQGNEQISDQEYDALIEELRRENPNSALLPENEGIAGSDLKGIAKKYKLPVTMGTLAKCNTDADIKTWWSKHSHDDLIAELKIDGSGILFTYKNGELVQALSRGDSQYGEDKTAHVKKILGEKKIDSKFCGHIRGEVVMKRSVFDKHFKKEFKNPRNLVAGVLGRDDLKNCEYLTIIAYDVFAAKDNKLSGVDYTEANKLKFLAENGFELPEQRVPSSVEDLINWKNEIDTANAEIPCDGIVIKQNAVDNEDLKRKTPMNNVAFKPNLQVAVTKVIGIDWTLSGRYLAPTAIVEPVELEGTTVQRASLANINKMIELGIEIGSTVLIKKSGMIIPHIEKVL